LALTFAALTTLVVSGCAPDTPLAKAPPIEVVVSQPIKEKIADWDVFTGTIEAMESVEVRPRVRGHIKEIHFKEGDEIAAGQELFIIDSEPFQADLKQANGQLKTWEAKQTLAEETIKIYKPLAEKGSVAKEELLKAYAMKNEAIGGIDSARGKIMESDLNIAFCKIASPIAGKVGQALMTKGNLVNATGENLLTTVVSVDPMYFYFHVNERALLNYQKLLRQQAERQGIKDEPKTKPVIPVEMALVNETDFPHKGFVDFVDNRVDPATGSIKVRARFDNPKGAGGRRDLSAGLFARVRVVVAEPYDAVLVADRAILADQSLKYVLVVNKAKENTVQRVDVDSAHRVQENGLRVVDAGLKGDEWVIVEGVNRARPGAIVAPKDGPMPRRPTKGETEKKETKEKK
jgi:RND family efflux transporter MFP subunit